MGGHLLENNNLYKENTLSMDGLVLTKITNFKNIIPVQRSKLRPFWSPWRVEKKIGDQNCQEGRQFGDLFPDHLICFNLHPDIIKSYDHKTVQCPLPS